MSKDTILLVEDEAGIRFSTRRFFEAKGYEVWEAGTAATGESVFRSSRPDIVFLDYCLPDGDGIDVLRAFRKVDASVPVIILTAHGSIDVAVRAIKEGAEQFFTKPVELPALLVVVERLLENRRNRQLSLAGKAQQEREVIDPFLGESAPIRRLAETAKKIAGSNSLVLIQGETGTGKGVLAGWLHRNGPRARGAFVDLNCAGLSREFLESELFGHEKGAFTGALSAKPGLFEIAHAGTLFLDEVGDIDLQVQPKILKVLEEQRFRRLGSVMDRQVDVRLIAATHQDLSLLVEQGGFRKDLLYRVSAIPIEVPPLRERGNDVVILARSILGRIAHDLGRHGMTFSPDAERALVAYGWPGNIRELRNVLERAALLSSRTLLTLEDFSECILPTGSRGEGKALTLQEAERGHIVSVLRASEQNVPRAASALGISRSALYEKIKKHGISLPRSGS
jgi:DNA-binding NtrC family response regulator